MKAAHVSAPKRRRSARPMQAAAVVLAGVLESSARADLEFELDVASSAGVAVNEGLSPGAYVRPDVDFFLYAGGRSVQPIIGYAIGLEWWSAPGAFGFGLPAMVKGGMRFGPSHSPGFATMMRLGLGFSVFQVDNVKDPAARAPHALPAQTGGGIYTPTLSADIAFGNAAFRVGAEVRASYRWEWIIDDRPQVQLGLTLSFPLRVAPAGGEDD
jgi:hypothetical protein